MKIIIKVPFGVFDGDDDDPGVHHDDGDSCGDDNDESDVDANNDHDPADD